MSGAVLGLWITGATLNVVSFLGATIGIGIVAKNGILMLDFANGEEGTVTIAKEFGEKLTVAQTLKTVVGARTMALDPGTHNIYLPAPTPAFRVLIYGSGKP